MLKNKLSTLIFPIITILFSSCIHNYEPVIIQLSAEPNPAQQGDIINLSCIASDDDSSTLLKDENLSYEWFATTGEIISENLDNNARWTAPQESGKYSISCIVTDESGGLDISTIEVMVQ
tara:strand:- start:2209 stop:2568 length:360 start_codon:yes stop_codon:yes gene_type:complete